MGSKLYEAVASISPNFQAKQCETAGQSRVSRAPSQSLPRSSIARSILAVEHYLRCLLAVGVAAAALGLTGCGSDSPSDKNNASGKGGSSNSGGDSSVDTAGTSSSGKGSMTSGGMSTGPACTPAAATESQCSDGKDSDCDGFVDCLDTDCDGKACGNGLSCLAGACLGSGKLPDLPRIENLVPTVRGDNVVVTFQPFAGAVDYRIYPLPADEDVLVGAGGEVVIRDAIYRCSGARPRKDRSVDELKATFPTSLAGDVHGYKRTEAESKLGYVYLSPGADRKPIYRVANPNSIGGYAWEYDAPPGQEFNGADYVDGEAARDALLAKGWRDDGIAFYAPTNGTVSVYRREFAKQNGFVSFYTDGPEKAIRDKDDGEGGERFKVLADAAEGAVPLYRIFYGIPNDHDNLAAGDANKERVLIQGQAPVAAATWTGLKESTTLVIEALDKGCPFPGGYVGATSAPADVLGGVNSLPSLTLDEGRLPDTGEVFINGQFDAMNRPKPIARAYVNVDPKPHPKMDWYQTFDSDADVMLDKVVEDGVGTKVFRNEHISLEMENTTPNYSYGQLLGQLVVGSSATFTVAAVDANATLAPDKYLHATMTTDFASTNRRYPQIFITDAPLGDPSKDPSDKVPVTRHLGRLPFNTNEPPSTYHSIFAQPFSGGPELQIEFCDQRGWGVSAQCPKANIYGFPAGSNVDWKQPWNPVPVIGDYVGHDRLVKFDMYASTKRVYVFLEDKPAGCAVLPDDRMPAGPVTVVFGIAAYHIEIDEYVDSDVAPQQYLRRFSLAHTQRKLDDLGIESGVDVPAWDESVLPCGDRFYVGFFGAN